MSEIKKVSSLPEFLSEISSIRSNWQQADTLKPHQELWFRGEADDYCATKLQPQLYRSSRDAEVLLRIEYDLYQDFWRCGAELAGRQSIDSEDAEWDWYFIMQHHNAPTRFLDWTDGALMALHFALKTNCDRSKPAVYVLNPYAISRILEKDAGMRLAKKRWKEEWNRGLKLEGRPYRDRSEYETLWLPYDKDQRKASKLPSCPMLFDPDHLIRRIGSQRSRLMLFGSDKSWLYDLLMDESTLIVQMLIQPGAVTQMRTQLRDSGVTESVIYPDLDGLGREMQQLWQERQASEK